RRPPPLRLELALLDLGQPVLSGYALLAPARQLRPGRRDGGRPRLLRRPLGPARRARPRARGATPERRLHHGDLPVIVAHIMGIPTEESLPQLAPVGAGIVTAFALTVRTRLDRVRRWGPSMKTRR